MVTQRKPKASKYLTTPTRPVQVDRDRSVAGLLEKMEGAGFGGRQLAEAHRIWLDMLGDNTTIIVAGSGALIPAGMRRLLAYVIKNRLRRAGAFGSLLFHDCRKPCPLSFPGPSKLTDPIDRRDRGMGPARDVKNIVRPNG